MPCVRPDRRRPALTRPLAALLLSLTAAGSAAAETVSDAAPFQKPLTAPAPFSAGAPDAPLARVSLAPARLVIAPAPDALGDQVAILGGDAPERPADPPPAAEAAAPLRSAPAAALETPRLNPAPRVDRRPAPRPVLKGAPPSLLSPPRPGRSERLAADRLRLRVIRPARLALQAPTTGAALDRASDPERDSAPSRIAPETLGRPVAAPPRAARIDAPTGGRWRFALDPIDGLAGAVIRPGRDAADYLGFFCAPANGEPARFAAARFRSSKAVFASPRPPAFTDRLRLRIGARFLLRREIGFREGLRPYRLFARIDGGGPRVVAALQALPRPADRLLETEIFADGELAEALMRGRSVTVIEERSGAGRQFSLRGSRRALERTIRFCAGAPDER